MKHRVSQVKVEECQNRLANMVLGNKHKKKKPKTKKPVEVTCPGAATVSDEPMPLMIFADGRIVPLKIKRGTAKKSYSGYRPYYRSRQALKAFVMP